MGARRLFIVLTGINTAVLAVLLIRSASLFAASDPETIRARAIELVDRHGRVRGQLNVEPNGEAVFRLRDAKGEIRVKLGADGEGSSGTSVTLTSKAGQRRVITP